MNSRIELVASLKSEIHYSIPPNAVDCSNEEPLFWDSCRYVMKKMWLTRDTNNVDPNSKDYKKVVIRELCVYLVFLIIFTMVAFMSIGHESYFITTSIHDVFANSLASVRSEDSFWNFLTTTFVDEVFREKFYSDRFAKESEKGYILNENKIIGLTRLRQLRGQNYSCGDKSKFAAIIGECFKDYSRSTENHAQFGLKYGTAWNYKSSAQLDGRPLLVSIYKYDGGGFIQILGTTKLQSLKIINNLQQHFWIDRLTRAVFLEFTVYNANINIFTLVRLIVEFPVVGGVHSSSQLTSQKLIRYYSRKDVGVLMLEICIYLFVVYYIIEEILEIRTQGIVYFIGFWNMLDIAVLAICISCLVLNIKRYYGINALFRQIHFGESQFYNFVPVSYLQSMFDDLIAINLFIIWIKLFKYVGFNKTLAQFTLTISKGANDIFGFFTMFSIVFVAFAQFSSLIFGSRLKEFKTVTDASFTQFRIILGDFDYYKLESADKILGPLYFFMYVFFVFYILLNMFLAIVNDAYQEVKGNDGESDNLNILTSIKDKYNKFMGKLDWKFHVYKFKSFLSNNAKSELEFETLRTELKQLGYSDLEIEGLFSQYTDRKDRVLEEADLLKLEDHLKVGELMEWREDSQFTFEGRRETYERPNQSELVAKEDFKKVEKKVAILSQTVEEILKVTNETEDKLKKHHQIKEEYISRYNEMMQNPIYDEAEELKSLINHYINN